MRTRHTATQALAAWILSLLMHSTPAQTDPAGVGMDQAVLAELAASRGVHAAVTARIDLTAPFGTRSSWTLIAAKQPDAQGLDAAGLGDREGAVFLCFIHQRQVDCAPDPFLAPYRQRQIRLGPGEQLFYTLFESRIVHGKAHRPLLSIKACTSHSGNGSCGILSYLFAYDAATDRFRAVFSNLTGSNNNQATRFIESGPLQGDVVVAYPTSDAPFRYWVEVYRPGPQGDYHLRLRYRGRTGYGDGNPLPVIDAEMPGLLGRLGLWKAGDAIPTPPVLPEGCSQVFLRRGAAWCGPPSLGTG